MEPGEGARVTVAIDGESVQISAAGREDGFRVSPRGMMELRGEARRLLEQAENRHFWFELNDDDKQVWLRPY